MIDVDWELLFRYREGKCTPEESAAFERWLSADAQHRMYFDAAVRAGALWLDEMDAEAERQGVRVPTDAKLPEPPSTPAAAPTPVIGPGTLGKRATRPTLRLHVPARRRRSFVLPVAAAATIAAAGVFAWRAFSPSITTAPDVASAMSVVTTRPGQRAELRLRDGTRVVLGVASTLRYADDYGARAREVSLSGEAYFDVIHDNRRPFVVHAGNAVAEDLGTAFVVRAYPGDADVRVVVADGKVALRAAEAFSSAARVLERGQLGQLRIDGEMAVRQVDPDNYLSWTGGELVFDDTPLSEVIRQLERWYDLDVRLADSALASRPLTASFKDKTITQVLELLGPSLDVRYERDGRTVMLFPRGNGG